LSGGFNFGNKSESGGLISCVKGGVEVPPICAYAKDQIHLPYVASHCSAKWSCEHL
jgi:hypothetical protein